MKGHIINKKGKDVKNPEECKQSSWKYLDEHSNWVKDDKLSVKCKLIYEYCYQSAQFFTPYVYNN